MNFCNFKQHSGFFTDWKAKELSSHIEKFTLHLATALKVLPCEAIALTCQQLQAFMHQHFQSAFLVMQDLITKVTWSNFSRKSALGLLKLSGSVTPIVTFQLCYHPWCLWWIRKLNFGAVTRLLCEKLKQGWKTYESAEDITHNPGNCFYIHAENKCWDLENYTQMIIARLSNFCSLP